MAVHPHRCLALHWRGVLRCVPNGCFSSMGGGLLSSRLLCHCLKFLSLALDISVDTGMYIPLSRTTVALQAIDDTMTTLLGHMSGASLEHVRSPSQEYHLRSSGG